MKRFVITTLIILLGANVQSACKLKDITTGAACSIQTKTKQTKPVINKQKKMKQNLNPQKKYTKKQNLQ